MTAEALTVLVTIAGPSSRASPASRRSSARDELIELGVARRSSAVLEAARRPQALRCWVVGSLLCGLHVLDDDPPYLGCTAWRTDPRTSAPSACAEGHAG
jgi:hypothetical protein